MRLIERETLWFSIGTSLCIAVSTIFGSANARSEQVELVDPPVCSAFELMRSALSNLCEVTPLTPPGHKPAKTWMQVKVFLQAQSKRIVVGGYRVTTENYGTYVPPVVEAKPGDTVAAHLMNSLHKPVLPDPHGAHDDSEENPTNLHYFHGGIVSPNNSRPTDAQIGDGDNIYVYRRRGETFDYRVPIPDQLDARVLEDAGPIPHPSGLNWYHSHLHGISSTQVMGGLSGLLSVGDARANVKAACLVDPADNTKCTNPVEDDTAYLIRHTDVKYVLLRDISLKGVSRDPKDADGTATATWAPEDRDFPENTCGILNADGSIDFGHPEKHQGYCQRADTNDAINRVWLFTLNGQRFPKITTASGRNALLRMGNLSANTPYWLELECETGCDQVPESYRLPKREDQPDKVFVKLEVLSLDGVVPATFVRPGDADKPKANTFVVGDFLLMPASRVELYVRNDQAHTKQISYLLRTKKLKSGGTDVWPQIQLARIILEPTAIARSITLALNSPVSSGPQVLPTAFLLPKAVEPPPGCVRDLDSETNLAKREHRRVTFQGIDPTFSVATEIVHFPDDLPPDALVEERKFVPNKAKTVGTYDDLGKVEGIPFEAYDNGDGTIDWSGTKKWAGQPLKHVCITPNLDGPFNPVGHMQLWALVNKTDTLHNFHIHQMKFRLAKVSELNKYRIVPGPASTCVSSQCDQPNYRLYDDETGPKKLEVEWHDTIPVPKNRTVFIIMSFDAKEQLGRYVYHCHILKHEDHGLMAPIEVIDSSTLVK